MCQDRETLCRPTLFLPRSWRPIRCRPHWSGRTTSTVTWVHLLADLCWSVHEAIPNTTITAEAVAQAFLSGWISRSGVPPTIVTDRGRQFESHLWDALMTMLGSKQAQTTAYHPQANSMVERFHRQLKAALKAQTNPMSWMDVLPLVLLGYCSRDVVWCNAPSPQRIFHSHFLSFAASPFRSRLTTPNSHAKHQTPTASTSAKGQSCEWGPGNHRTCFHESRCGT